MVWRYILFFALAGVLFSSFGKKQAFAVSQSEGKKATGKAKNALPPGWINKEHPRLEKVKPLLVPDIPFYDENDQPHVFEEFYGQVVLLNFWATWCTPCTQEMPGLSKLQKDFKRKNFKIVALSQDFKGAAAVKDFYDVNEITNLNIYVDPKNALFKAFAVIGLPTSILIDAEGNEIARIIGIVDWENEDIRQFILSYTDQKTYNVPVKPPAATVIKTDNNSVTVATPMAVSDTEKKAASGMMIPVTQVKAVEEAPEKEAKEKPAVKAKNNSPAKETVVKQGAAKATAKKEPDAADVVPENAVTMLPGAKAAPASLPDLADPTARRRVNDGN